MIDATKHRVLAKAEATLDALDVFYKAKWSQVRDEDTVLVREHGYIQEARVVEIRMYNFEGQSCVKATLNPVGSQRRYISAFWPGDAVHIKSRF
jgi:hypothetical protein